jgi:hypothetical protein
MRVRAELPRGAELASAAADAPRDGRAFVCLSAQMMLERLGAELRVTCADSLGAIVRGGIGAHAPAGSGAREGAAHVVALGRCGASPQWRSERTRRVGERRVGDKRSAPPRGLGLRGLGAKGFGTLRASKGFRAEGLGILRDS